MSLTDRTISNIKATGKPQKHSDGGGLYIHVTPTGNKLWKLAYRFGGKQKSLSFGPYPLVPLKKARELRDDAKLKLMEGIDPGVLKQQKKRGYDAGEGSFSTVAREWHVKFLNTWTDDHGEKILARLEKDIFPYIGRRNMMDIKPPEVLMAIRHIEERGALETAHRALQICGKIFKYAVATGRAERDVTADLKGALPPVKVIHHPTIINPKEVGKLLRAIDNYQGQYTVACALKMAPLVFVRPGELRGAGWDEFDMEKAEWRIPAERMKMKEQHIVPLATQTLALLKELHTHTGDGMLLFPGMRTPDRPISNNTINAALRRIGYAKEEMTGHGFRSMASTLLNEQGWNRDAIERQLAHAERSKVRAAYNFAEFLPERRKMMQAWADYLAQLRDSGM
jgi:integrase